MKMYHFICIKSISYRIYIQQRNIVNLRLNVSFNSNLIFSSNIVNYYFVKYTTCTKEASYYMWLSKINYTVQIIYRTWTSLSRCFFKSISRVRNWSWPECECQSRCWTGLYMEAVALPASYKWVYRVCNTTNRWLMSTAPPTPKVACFVLYLKIFDTLKYNICICKQIVQGTQK